MLRSGVLAWINYAKRDIELVDREMSYVRNPRLRPYEIILHHCHQCAEKMLKAYILNRGGVPDYTHDLNRLRKMSIGYDNDFNGKRITDYCIYLDAFWNVKYPDFTVTVDASHTSRGINCAKRIYDFVSIRLGLEKEFFK